MIFMTQKPLRNGYELGPGNVESKIAPCTKTISGNAVRGSVSGRTVMSVKYNFVRRRQLNS